MDQYPVPPFRRRRFLGLAAATAVVGLGTVGCTPSTGSSKAGGRLKIATSDASPNDTLDPLRLERTTQILAACMIYESLTDLDKNMKPVGRLAESFETPDGGVTWDFKLHSSVTFHDGKPLTPDDVIFSISRALDPNEGSGNSLATQLKGILRPQGIRAVDGKTVRFVLEKTYVPFPSAMATRFARIYRAGTKDFARPMGTGPFVFESFKPGQSFAATRYDKYWGGAPKLDGVEAVNYANESTRLSAFMDSDVDLMFNLEAASAPDILAAKGHTLLQEKNAQWIPLALDTTVKPFNDPNLVRAIKLAVDRDQVIKVGLGGYGSLGYDNPIASNDFFSARLPQPTHDPDAARKLLARAGYGNGLKLPTLTCLDFGPVTSMALVLQQQLQAVGIRFDITRESAATFWTDSWLKKPFYSNTYTRRVPDEILELCFTSNGGWNMSRRKDRDIDAAIKSAAKTTDVAKQKQQYAIAQRLIAQRDSTIVSAHQHRLSALAAKVSGVDTNPVHYFDLRKAGVST
ncbi:ABC transporter substrate-binding protein [Streptomyces sp. NPDC017964]|uniref:ABC transporter substrate-binding protein n=1 Tax=Streptomyces sp. NPDC017964 TaxID=3365022 RepID=UPI0037A8A696